VPFRRNRESRGREVRFVHPEYGTAGAGIWPEQCPGKCVAEEGSYFGSVRLDRRRLREKATSKTSLKIRASQSSAR